jgi:hypothetical protein
VDRQSAVEVDSLDDQVSWGRTPEWGLEQSAGTMRSRRRGARSRASSIGRRTVWEWKRLLLSRCWWWCLLVKGAVGKVQIENGGRERVTGGGLGESVYVSNDLWMCSGNGGSSVEVEKRRRRRRKRSE